MASASLADVSMETEAPHAAVTRERKLNTDLQEQLPKPCKQSKQLLLFFRLSITF
jgi:hypothetical protein